MKTCLHCKRERPEADFYKSKKHTDGRLKVCKFCRIKQTQTRDLLPGVKLLRARQSRDAHLRRTYGLSLEDYNALYDQQEGRCVTCDRPCSRGGQVSQSLCVDHDHLTGRLRGLLCHDCNTTLGRVRDDPKILRRLADYLVTDR